MVEITKGTAMYIRKNLPDAHIVKTLRSKGGSKGKYYVEDTDAVQKLITQYQNQKFKNIIYEYPASEQAER